MSDLDWYGCDTTEQSRRPSLTRPHSVAADAPMSPAWADFSCSSKLHTNTPVGSRQSSAKARHERQRRHYIENGVEEPRYDDNDLLERHRRLFRKERPFTPRTLHHSGMSKLSTMSSCYRNPCRNRSRVDSPDPADNNVERTDQSDSRPGTSGAMSDNFSYNTLPGQRHDTVNEVPPLGISLDPDQIMYLRQQSHRQEYKTVTEADVNKMEADPVTSRTAQRNITSLMATKHQL